MSPEELPPLDDELRSLLAEVRGDFGSPDQVQLLEAGLAEVLGPAPPPSGGGGAGGGAGSAGAGSGGASGALGSSFGAPLLWAGGIAAVIAGGLYVASGVYPPPSTPQEPVPVAIEAPQNPLSLEVAPDSLEPAPSEVPTGRRARRHRAVPDETELLESARRSLARAPQRSLRLTARHRRLFGSGALDQEREVIAIDALTRLGRTRQARVRAARFVRRFPRSGHRRRIETLLEPDAPASAASSAPTPEL